MCSMHVPLTLFLTNQRPLSFHHPYHGLDIVLVPFDFRLCMWKVRSIGDGSFGWNDMRFAFVHVMSLHTGSCHSQMTGFTIPALDGVCLRSISGYGRLIHGELTAEPRQHRGSRHRGFIGSSVPVNMTIQQDSAANISLDDEFAIVRSAEAWNWLEISIDAIISSLTLEISKIQCISAGKLSAKGGNSPERHAAWSSAEAGRQIAILKYGNMDQSLLDHVAYILSVRLLLSEV